MRNYDLLRILFREGTRASIQGEDTEPANDILPLSRDGNHDLNAIAHRGRATKSDER